MIFNHGREFVKKSDGINCYHTTHHISFFQTSVGWKKKPKSWTELYLCKCCTSIRQMQTSDLVSISLVFRSRFSCNHFTEKESCCKMLILSGSVPESLLQSFCTWLPAANLNPHLTFKRIWEDLFFCVSSEGMCHSLLQPQL